MTDDERNANPLEPNMPSQLYVQLKPGDMVFYNNNILHRGAYKHDIERMTLHGSIGHVDGGSLRARNVLQHGRGWIEGVDLSHVAKPERAQGMRERLLAMGAEHKNTGFSQND